MGRFGEEYSHKLYVNMNTDFADVEKWKDIPYPTKYRYQASNYGRICHLYPSGKRRLLTECYLGRGWKTGIMLKNGIHSKYMTATLVSRTWLGECPKGYQVIHKNGVLTDNRVSNLEYVPMDKKMAKVNRAKRKPVCKVDVNGDIVQFYKSAKECSVANGYSYSSIKHKCNDMFVDVIGTDGYAYCYDTKKSYSHLLDRLNVPKEKQKELLVFYEE